MAKEQGLELLYLPPYSPDLNPIEKLWSQVKLQWKKELLKVRGDIEEPEVVKIVTSICDYMEKYNMKKHIDHIDTDIYKALTKP